MAPPNKSHNQLHCANPLHYHSPLYSCLCLTTLACKSGPLHAKRQSAAMQQATENGQQQKHGGQTNSGHSGRCTWRSLYVKLWSLWREKLRNNLKWAREAEYVLPFNMHATRRRGGGWGGGGSEGRGGGVTCKTTTFLQTYTNGEVTSVPPFENIPKIGHKTQLVFQIYRCVHNIVI